MTLRKILSGFLIEERNKTIAIAAAFFCWRLWQAGEISVRSISMAALFTVLFFAFLIGMLLFFVWSVRQIGLLFGVPLGDWGSIRAIKAFISRQDRKLARQDDGRWPASRGRTQFLRGIALGELGRRGTDTDALRQSAIAFRDALPALDAAGKHTKWALTQRNLAVTLLHLSLRELGTSSLEEAVDALNKAADAWRKADNKADWGEEQFLLCAALTRIGRMEDGTARLAEAVAAGRRSLTAEDNSEAPLADAKLQIHLVEALIRLGERESGTERLDEAVAMARESLKVIVEDEEDLLDDKEAVEWPARQSGNLGMALRLLGDRRHDARLLTEAVDVLGSTTALRTETSDYDWAMNQHELAHALQTLSRHAARPELPSQSLAASDAALAILTQDTYPFDWADATATRANTLTWMVRESHDRATLRRAADDLRAALAVFDQARAPVQRRQYRDDLARVEALLDQAGGAGSEAKDSAPPGPVKPRPA